MAGWPVQAGNQRITGLAAADLNGDGSDEVVAALGNRVSIFDTAGQLLTTWLISTRGQVTAGPVIGHMRPTDRHPSVVAAAGNTIFLWAADGALLARASMAKEGRIETLALGDINDDHELEVLGSTATGMVAVWNANLTPVHGWPVRAPQRGPLEGLRVLSLADPRTTLIASAQAGRWVAWDSEGRPIPAPSEATWAAEQAPVLADLDADGDMEWVTIASLNGQLQPYVWDDSRHIRQPMVGWPQAGQNARRTSAHSAVDLEELTNPQLIVPLVRSDELDRP
jgi:hypothetical protein